MNSTTGTLNFRIGPLARQVAHFHRPWLAYPNARSAFKAFLQLSNLHQSDEVLLPAYIGWSPREGSGVFDPICDLSLQYHFYRLDGQLHIDLEHLEKCLKTGSPKVLVIIHYFGYVDPNYVEAVSMARHYDIQILEDEAHAMLTDLVGGVTGRLGDACIFSLHKLLPLDVGGLLIFNQGQSSYLKAIEPSQEHEALPWDYDLEHISRRRRHNAELLSILLQPLVGEVDPIREQLVLGEVPQTYPVLVRNVSRDELYFMMNEAGFGAVTLYHTLIKPITAEEFPNSYKLARNIFNLPIHQDIQPDMLETMVDHLSKCIKELRTRRQNA